MGVFTVGRQVALEIDMPGWWLANASVDMDFRRGLYYDSSTANPRAATDFLSCVRASVGYAKTNAGALTSFASNALRITDLGLLVEDARTNVLTQTADFSNAVWNQSFTTVTADAAVAPDGTTTADKLIPAIGSNEHNIYQAQNNASGSYTWSAYLKPAGYNFGSIDCIDAAGNRYCVVFSLITGAATANSTSGTPAAAVTFSEVLGNGWVRVGVNLASGGTSYMQLGACDTGTPSFGGSNNPGFVGDGSSGIYAWGAQLEAGSFPSSYIPTTSAAATRAADLVTCAGNLLSVADGSTGSLVADIIFNTTLAQTNTNARIVADATGASQTLLYWRTSPNQIGTFNASVELSAALGGSQTFPTGAKVGTSWNDGTPARSVVGGGGTVATDAGTSGTRTGDALGSHVGATANAYLYYRRLTVWNSKLADATLQGFTAP